ncbi:hypothetical protein [Desulforegula conservatrix]|uniref:hypothetical protein n=1 Tax=Desulforegula conservatrix TaxID=153026 RepID=UPI0003F51C81|nr:hypothetical protein [Desulforegula conservatrix]
MIKHFAVIILVSTLLIGCASMPKLNKDGVTGEWRFAYVQKTLMPNPPAFDTIDFKKNGKVFLKNSLMNRSFNGNYTVTANRITWSFQPPDMKRPVEHELSYSWSEYGQALVLRLAKGDNGEPIESEFVYYKPDRFISTDDIIGTWEAKKDGNTINMSFYKDGSLHMDGQNIRGYYRLWKSNMGNTLTTTIWVENEGGLLVNYLYKLHNGKLMLAPASYNGTETAEMLLELVSKNPS